jgi:fumarate reductase flavoprotein subunit
VKSKREVDVDVVVAGAGGAGLAASLRAAESGLSVALVETTEHFRSGNNTSMSTAMIPAGGSRWQEAAGIDDSPARFAADVMAKTKQSADPTITAALTGVAPELVAWLADSCGLDLSLVTDFIYPGHSRFRCHSVPNRSGHELLRVLLSEVDRRANIDLAVPMTLRSVSLSAEGDVEFVEVAGGDGTPETISCHAVTLASGGFAANHELISELIPEIASANYHGGDGCRGDALRIGRTLSADVGYLDAYQGHGSVAIPQSIIMTWAAIMHGAVILNSDGRRFADETQGYSEFAEIVLREPGGIGFVILDEEIHRRCLTFADYTDVVENHGVHWVESADELADAIGAERSAVAAELEAVRDSSLSGVPDAFGRTEFAHPLEPPFGYVKTTGALFHTQGGMMVSSNAQVLRSGSPIGGLYAAGGAAAGMSGHGASGYLAGNGLLAALGFGYLAGTDIGHKYAS